MKWIELTETGDKKPIHVNMEQASSMQRNGNRSSTTIWFLAGHDDGKITVHETPEDILKMLNGPGHA